jgi:outer membrane protein OmpA-like peptidoglycan-associated protein
MILFRKISVLLLLSLLSGCMVMGDYPTPTPSKSSQEGGKLTTIFSDEDKTPYVLILMDSSGSMNDLDEYGQIKIEAAKANMQDILGKFPVGGSVYVSLVDFAGGICGPDNYDHAKLLVDVDNFNPNLVQDKVNMISASGDTPLARTIRIAGNTLKQQTNKATIILVSDGEDTCGGDPCREAIKLNEDDIFSVKIYPIGYGVDLNTENQLRCVAEKSNGQYFSARSAINLERALYDIVKSDVIQGIDDDFDGVPNELDKCPATEYGYMVDDSGCEVGYTFKIHFEFDSYAINDEFLPNIETFAKYLKTQDVLDISVDLHGHTDSVGSYDYNQRLSQNRAKAVVNELIRLGVSSSRLKYHGFSSSRPIAENDTPRGRYRNRRVEAILK